MSVENLISATNRRTYFKYRAIQLVVNLTRRRASFLGSPEWIDPTWKPLDPHSSQHLQTIIDHAFRIPNLVERFDALQRSIQVPGSMDMTDGQILHGLILDALDIQKYIEQWEASITEGDDKSQLYIVRLADHGSFVSADIGKTFPVSYTFPNWDTAAALAYLDTAQIFLSQLLIDMKTCARASSATYPGLNFPALGVESMISKAIESADRIC